MRREGTESDRGGKVGGGGLSLTGMRRGGTESDRVPVPNKPYGFCGR